MDIVTRKLAKEQGLPNYFTGAPCKHGHVAKRTTSDGQCHECSRLRSVKFRDLNPKYASTRYHAQRDRLSKQNKQYYQNNKARIAEYSKAFYADPDARAKHLETCASWRERTAAQEQQRKLDLFSVLACNYTMPTLPTERDFKYWLAGQLLSRGYVVFNEYYLDDAHTSCIDLLVPELKLGIECKLTSHNWTKPKVEAQRARYQRLLDDQGYRVCVVSLDGSLGIDARALLESL